MRLNNIKITLACAFVATCMTANAAEIQKGGTLTYSFTPEPPALSTVVTTAVPVAIASTKIFESLLEWSGPELTPEPGLAQSWVVSPDFKTFTFKLRKDVLWQDGKPFTSEDVKFSVEKIIRPYHARGKLYYKNLVGVDTPDAYTVVFHLSKPVPFFLKAFQPTETPIFPKHILASEDLSKIRQSPFMQHPVGTGPFQLEKWEKGSYIILKKNEHYWKSGHPYLDKIVLRVIPDDNARMIALQNGEIDLAPMNAIPASAIGRFEKETKFVVSHDGTEGLGPVAGLMLNLRNKPLDNVTVRKAISLALDRNAIAKIIFFGQASPATNPIIKANPEFYDKSLPAYKYDPAEANKLLDSVGLTKKSDGYRLSLDYRGLPYGSSWVRLGEYVKLALGKVGINVRLHDEDMGTWLRNVYGEWNYDIASTFLHDYADPSVVFDQEFATAAIVKGGTFNNAMGYSNKKLDEILDQARQETNLESRRKLYFEAENILHNDMPEIFLVDLFYTSVWNKRVHGLIKNGISMYSNWDSVYISH